MSTAATLRVQIESALAHRIPAALSPAARLLRPVVTTRIAAVDELLDGGVPLGAVTEIAGPECSGRTSLALSVLAQMTREGRAVAWADACDALDPESAAQAGVVLERLLWVRCGAARRTESSCTPMRPVPVKREYFTPPAVTKGLHGGGCGPHPRSEERGLPEAVRGLLTADGTAAISPRCAEPQRRVRTKERAVPWAERRTENAVTLSSGPGPMDRLAQALRVADLLLQAGGFGAVVIDLGGLAPEVANRVPAATWFRYRAAAEKSQTVILLLTQHPCAQSSAGLAVRMQPSRPCAEEPTVFTGMEHTTERVRPQFGGAVNVAARKPPQRASVAQWMSGLQRGAGQ